MSCSAENTKINQLLQQLDDERGQVFVLLVILIGFAVIFVTTTFCWWYLSDSCNQSRAPPTPACRDDTPLREKPASSAGSGAASAGSGAATPPTSEAV